ncbi:hypothetical protein SteCoe_27978 [Stentor coeruleus]|uniref:Uncharacterized protein n=1 Tax=Stentor coeruleus TaxID=5963 RepID=A0A1R2B986_9CILI|nr:hypothetical protein SteCoe_27978 [Stentor coeruleus]
MPKLAFPEPEGLKENLEAFFTAVKITEPLCLGIISFNVIVFLLIVFTRTWHKLQIVIFVSLLTMCYFLESFNKYLEKNWKIYATQNYFDSSGLFICIMIGFPALFNCVVIMINSFRNTWSLVSNLAKERLKEKQKKKD